MVGQSTPKIASKEAVKHEKTCSDNQYVFIQFVFDTYDFLAPPEAVDILHRAQRVMQKNAVFQFHEYCV